MIIMWTIGKRKLNTIRRNNVLFSLFLFLSIVACLPALADQSRRAKIGVLAKRGIDQCLAEWQPTADYLSQNIPGMAFEILPLDYQDIYKAVEKKQVDFILANPFFYVGIERWYGANRIATLKNSYKGIICKTYGGVIFWRKNRKDIRHLEDISGKRFMAANEYSLAGWIIIWRELKERGLDPYQDLSTLNFGGNHDNVVYSVLNGQIDAGGVRTGILERMQAEGKIRMEDFTVLENLTGQPSRLPFVCTTREYPEWPMAKLADTPDELAEEVAAMLVQLSPDAPAAIKAKIAGWTIPLNYQSVHQCLRYLKLGPYKDLGKITLKDVILNYWHWIIFTALAFTSLIVFTGVILRLNSHLEKSRRKLQEEIQDHHKTFEALKEAKELADQASCAKSEFLANMSHEIRTPMSGVIAAAELAMNEPVPPQAAHYLKIIFSSANSLLLLINDILDFAKIEVNRLNLEQQPFMLDEIVDRIVNLFYNSAVIKQIEILVDIDPQIPRALVGDPLRFQQILTNLVGNAVKFTENGGFVIIGARAPEISKDEVMLKMWVKDTGVGISSEFMANLFEPFTQADASDTRRYEGSGLGLSICRRLVEMMGGQIRVESELGRGSQFSFTAKLKRQSKETSRKFLLPPDLENLRVLVVDNRKESARIVSRYLESFGFSAEIAETGDQALTLIKNRSDQNVGFHLVIVDRKLTETDGLQISKQIQEKYAPGLPVIMMTAFGKEIERAEAQKIGIQNFLIKPVYQSTLFEAIMNAFGKESLKKPHRPETITDNRFYKEKLKGFRLLVVEDNATKRENTVAILQNAGIATETANDGREAVEKVQNKKFDAVLMDIQMPEMDGFQATRSIRSDTSFGELPIIAMTAHPMGDEEKKCMETGMDGYIAKPVNQAKLLQKLWQILKNKRPVMEKKPSSTTAPVTESAQPLPDRINGIHIRKVLDTMKLDALVYRRLLSEFHKNNLKKAEKIYQAIESQDLNQVAFLAHSLTKSAANIGANQLKAAAEKLASAAGESARKTSLESLASETDMALSAVLSAILGLERKRRTGEEFERRPAALEKSQIIECLKKLAKGLQIFDPQAVEKQMQGLKDSLAPENFKRLESLVDNYDYDEARGMVSDLIEEIETGKNQE